MSLKVLPKIFPTYTGAFSKQILLGYNFHTIKYVDFEDTIWWVLKNTHNSIINKDKMFTSPQKFISTKKSPFILIFRKTLYLLTVIIDPVEFHKVCFSVSGFWYLACYFWDSYMLLHMSITASIAEWKYTISIPNIPESIHLTDDIRVPLV